MEESPTFQYWDMVMGLEKLILTFARAHRERDFNLYVQSLDCQRLLTDFQLFLLTKHMNRRMPYIYIYIYISRIHSSQLSSLPKTL